jgi:hypothetical protein
VEVSDLLALRECYGRQAEKGEMKRGLEALIIGSSFVGIVMLLGYRDVATPIPLVVLSPGILVVMSHSGFGFNPEGEKWSLFSELIAFFVDVAVYGGPVYLFLNIRSYSARDRSSPLPD